MALTVEGPTPDRPAAAAQDVLLSGELGDAYVQRLVRGVRAARLNAMFPPETELCAHLSFLGRAGSSGLYEELRLWPQNGLPTAREILRVKIDKDLTAEFLGQAAAKRPPPEGSRMARRIAYYSRLAEQPVMPVNRVRVELRQQIPEENLAAFRVVMDRFDLACNQFVRYTILLQQRDRFWRRRHLIVDDNELSAPTEGFRRTVGRLASHEAELAFVLLSDVTGIEVEDVRRARVGPMLLPGLVADEALRALFDPERTPGAGAGPPWVLCFPEDRAGLEVAEHSGKDPLAPLFRDAVGETARELVDAKADELGYRVAKGRKFICPAPLRTALSQLCRDVGAPSIVRGV